MQIHRLAAARRARSRPRHSHPLIVQVADPLLMATALAMAGGDARRLIILSPTQVIVQNRPRGQRDIRTRTP
jgi:hypothetical protein